MKLFYKAGSCSLAPHIVMSELNMVYEIEAVDLATKTCASGDFKKINPKGCVPALRLESGDVLTESAVICQYLADQKMESNLMPKFGTLERYRTQEWMNFIASDVHKNFSPFFRTSVKNAEGLTELRAGTLETLHMRFQYVSEQLGTKEYLLGANFTVADAYLFTCMSWGKFVGLDLSKWSNLMAYQERVGTRPAVIRAMKEEGLI